MAFIPHSKNDIALMLENIGVKSIEDLFAEIPKALRKDGLNQAIVPAAKTEMEISRELALRAKQDEAGLCFIGAGAYEHHIPAVVWDIVSRGEFLTAYTPYQAEASQGTLQVIYEYQTMMASLMGLDVSNASMYDGATALAEAILMAIRLNNKSKSKKVLMPATVHPNYRKVVATVIGNQGVEIIDIGYDKETGKTDFSALSQFQDVDIAALVIPQVNFFGVLEDVEALTDWAHQHKQLVIACVNPLAMALLKEPGSWGKQGVDIACGSGQAFGVPLASGGPYFGFICCKQAYVRQMPGRIVGRTVDTQGRVGFTLTLQAREQHIRRAKATSNICTNQGLLMTAGTVYMSLLGPVGLKQVAAVCHTQTKKLLEKLTQIEGVQRVFKTPFFHEIVIQLPLNCDHVLHELAERGIQAGYSLEHDYPELGNALLVCVTETKTDEDLQYYCQQLKEILQQKKSEAKVMAAQGRVEKIAN